MLEGSLFIYCFSLTMSKGSSGAGEGFEVTKYGHGRVALIGFPRFASFVNLCVLMLSGTVLYFSFNENDKGLIKDYTM